MKIVTRKTDPSFIMIGKIGVWKKQDCYGTYYENDTNGLKWDTLEEVKIYAKGKRFDI